MQFGKKGKKDKKKNHGAGYNELIEEEEAK